VKLLAIEQSDGSWWGVPVELIARHRASHYASEFGGDVERSLREGTLPLFEIDSYEIEDWAANQMDWSDFDGHQVKIHEAPPPDFRAAWMNGDKKVVTLGPEPQKVLTIRPAIDMPHLRMAVTVEIPPRAGFLWAAIKSFCLQRPLRYTHTFTQYPHAQTAAPAERC
jgi:hypothetical protein